MKQSTRIFFMGIAMGGLSLLFICVLPLGHDLWFHMYRIGAMAVELENDLCSISIRILSDTYNGYGYAAPLYYGDFFLYIPAFLVNILDGNIVFVYKLLIVCIWNATFWIPYLCTKRILGEKAAFYLSFFNTFSVTCVTNLCIRNAIGEALAFVFLIPLLLSFYAILYKEKDYRNWLILALALSGIVQSHNLTTLIVGAVLIIWCVIDYKRLFREKRILECMKAAVLFLGLNASYIFPMLEQIFFQNVQTPKNSEYQKQAFCDYSLDFVDFFVPYDIKKIFNLGDYEYWHPGAVLLFPIVLLLVYYVYKKKVICSKKILIIFIGSVVGIVLLWFKPFIYVARNFLSFIQFPWRMMTIFTIGISIFATYLVCQIKNKKHILVIMGTAVGITCFAIGARYAYQIYVISTDYEYVLQNNQEFAHKYFYKYDKNAADNLYLPEGVIKSLYEERGETIASNHSDVNVSLWREKGMVLLSVSKNVYDDLWLELPLYMYKGYIACGENDILPIEKSKSGLIKVHIPKDNQKREYKVFYDGTNVQKISDYITLITIGYLCVYFVLQRRNTKENKL